MLAEQKTQEDLRLDPVFGEIGAFVVETTGNVRLSQNPAFLLEKITRRLQVLGLSSLEPYLAHLKNGFEGKDELDHLISELTIGETSFFRHREQFDALRNFVLPEALRRNESTKQLRIWSAGCSNGAEAYSIAIVLASLLGTSLPDWRVSIVGSDINRAFLAEAERGSYSPWILRNIPEEQLPLFFEPGQAWSIKDRYRHNVQFIRDNLLGSHAGLIAARHGPFDIVFCRNVMIYFDSENNRRLTDNLAATLGRDGFLFVAPADIHQHLYMRFDSENRIAPGVFRKRGELAPPPVVPFRAPADTQVSRPAAETPVLAGARKIISLKGTDIANRYRAAANRTPVSRPQHDAKPVKAGDSEPALELETVIESANRGDWAVAARQCEHLLEADRFNASVHYYHGLILQYTGDTREAEKAWRRAIYLDHKLALAHYQLGLARKEAGDIGGSAKAFRNAISALEGRPDDHPADPFDKITVDDLRELSARQLDLLEKP